MTKTMLIDNLDRAAMVLNVASAGLADAVRSQSHVNNALDVTRNAMARYDDSINALEAGTSSSLWNLFRSKDRVRKTREDARRVLVAARKSLAEFRGYLVNVQTIQESLGSHYRDFSRRPDTLIPVHAPTFGIR